MNNSFVLPGPSRAAGRRIMLSLVVTLLALITLGGLVGFEKANAVNPSIGLPQFQQLWDQADRAVAEGKVSRSYLWGPTLSDLITEPYSEGGTRQVQYFDKTRMEQTAGRGVTNGLLAKEMITGQLQLGDASFQTVEPNTTNAIAGDNAAGGATYATFRKVATINLTENRANEATGAVVASTLNGDGTTGFNADFITTYNVRNAFFEPTLGHNIPDVFFTFMNQTGPVYKEGNYSDDRVFDWVVAMGLPLSEAYWSRFVVAGKPQDVLVQAFERRVLTYTPLNPAAFRVEMGNVGQHYYQWRQAVLAPKPTPTPVPTTVAPTATPAVQVPTNIIWQTPVLLGSANTTSLQPLFNPVMHVRPTDGLAFSLGISGSGTGDKGYPAMALLLSRSDQPGVYTNIDSSTAKANAKFPHLAFAPNGTGYIVYRHWPDPDYRAYMRVMNPDGSLQAGIDLGDLYRANGGSGYLDYPDVAYSAKASKLYLVGEVATGAETRSIGFAESSDGGNSWSNFTLFAKDASKRGAGTFPHICVDNNDNIHLIYYDGSNVGLRSRINGQWGDNFRAADSAVQNWTFRGISSIACGNDGYAYAVWDGPNSFGVGRFTPGQGWKTLSNDVYPAYDARQLSALVTPDGRLMVAMGYFPGRDANPNNASLVVSTDRGQTFTGPQTVISHNSYNTGVSLDYNPLNGQLFYVTTFGDPRESYLVTSK